MNGFTHDGADPGAFEGQLVLPPSHEGQPTLDRFPQRPLHDDARRVWNRCAPKGCHELQHGRLGGLVDESKLALIELYHRLKRQPR